jgi:hypothetical protein
MISKVGKDTADPRFGSDVVAEDDVMLMLRSVEENLYGDLARNESPTVAAKPLADTPIDCADVIVTLGRLDGRTSIIIGINPVEKLDVSIVA